ncbi:cyclase [Mycobacterium sp. 852002-51057_SCH5723018]|nr:adenylate/guanylate cyclase domain-containing protein [Mycobacterium sp. 852002-51057_SCH5723018]OBG18861.1 cyclase [Mycobacterium sp. 852002-51057_SCH5723018]
MAAWDIGTTGLLDGLEGDARRDRAELIVWLLDRGFTVDEIRASVTPMLLPANRVMGDDGVHISAREMSRATGIDLGLLQALQRAAGLPRIGDPDAAVLPRADVQAVARAEYLLDFGVDTDDAAAIVRVVAESLGRAAAMMREPAFNILVTPGASEVDLAESADALARAAIPPFKQMVEDLLMLQLRHMFETEGITAAERATGKLPSARQVAVTFADLSGFTRLGESLPPDDLERVASRLAELAHDIAVPPVRFIKTVGDAVMFVSTDTVQLIDAVLDLIEAAAAHDLPPLRAGVAAGLAVSRAGDWYGSPVNIASRVTGLAPAGTVVVTDSARKTVGVEDGLVWSTAGAHRLRGVPGRVRLFRVSRA